ARSSLLLLRFFLWLPCAFFGFLPLEQSHIGNVNRALAPSDFPARIILRFSQVLLDNANAFNQHALLAWKHCEDSSGRTTEVPGNHLDVIAFFNVMLDAVHKSGAQASSLWGVQAPCLLRLDREDACRPHGQDGCVTSTLTQFIRPPGRATQFS